MENGEFTQMFFLSECPMRLKDELTGEGIELYVPYIGRTTKLDENDWSHIIDTSEECKWNYLKSSVYIDGNDVFQSEDYYPRLFRENGEDYYTPPEATFFPRLSITRYVLKEICSYLYWTAETVRCKESFTEEGLKEHKEGFNHYLDSINLDEILRGLKISIKTFYRHKAGDDDFYSADKIIELDNEVANNDQYLKKLIGIGTHELYATRSCGVPACSWGVDDKEYSESEIEEEILRIKEKYSRVLHMESLELSYLKGIYEESYDLLFEIPSWVKRLQNVHDALFEDFKLIIIKGHEQVCKFDLKWYIYDNILYKYKEINDELLAKINHHLKLVSDCDFKSFRERGVTKMGYWYSGYLDYTIRNL